MSAAPTPTVAEIDLDALRHNVRVVRERAGDAALMGVVKADAYGHGAVPVARALVAAGVGRLAVATVPEGAALRAAGIDAPLLVFAAPLPGFLPAYVRHGLEVTVPSLEAAEAVVRTAQEAGPLRVHVKVDTGMGRIGVPPAEAEAVVRRLERAPGVTLTGLWTHFATADEPGSAFPAEQLRRFEPVLRTVAEAFEHIHVANSGALFAVPESTEPLGARALARAGIALYGLLDLPAAREQLHPMMRLVSRVMHVKTVEPGTTISYGRRWRAERRTRIATIGAGYADGYRRLLSNRAEIGLGGRRYPVAGTVCMDMFMVDLGPPEGPGGAVAVGDEAVLFGQGGPSAFEVAAWAETITYEVTCGVSARVPRVYLGA
ncbi:MAG: alanine racemase [Rhodothermales bacterium]|nr:alanine racemase [Rhodothermales bacterium]